MKTLAAILLCLVTASCAYDDHPCGGSFSVDDSRIDAEALRRAGDKWNELSGQDRFRVTDGPGACSVRVDDVTTEGAWAEYRWKGGTAWIAVTEDLLRQPLRTFEAVMLHELGHSERLEHVRRGVMAQGDGHEDDFTDEDLAECRRAGLCPSL